MSRHEPPKVTIADIAPFPNIMDEESRRIDAGWTVFSMLSAIERIKRNATALLADKDLLAGENADPPDVTATYVLKDCRAALARLHDLTVACDNEDIRAAAEAAFRLGAIEQRMVNRVIYDKHIRKGRQQIQALSQGPAKKKKAALAKYQRINDAVAERLKKRGRRKQPSLTEIRRQVADQLDVPYQCVLDAAKGGRK